MTLTSVLVLVTLQKAELKDDGELEKEVKSFCAVCSKPWSLYRGQHRCPDPLCKVPVLVCYECIDAKAYVKKPPYCPLCVEGCVFISLST